jgi:hypothetical protein
MDRASNSGKDRVGISFRRALLVDWGDVGMRMADYSDNSMDVEHAYCSLRLASTHLWLRVAMLEWRYMRLNKVTSSRVATEASQILRSPKFGIKPKSVAGSALSQTPERNPFLPKPGLLGIRMIRKTK